MNALDTNIVEEYILRELDSLAFEIQGRREEYNEYENNDAKIYV